MTRLPRVDSARRFLDDAKRFVAPAAIAIGFPLILFGCFLATSRNRADQRPVEQLAPIHTRQLLTHLRMAKLSVGC